MTESICDIVAEKPTLNDVIVSSSLHFPLAI